MVEYKVATMAVFGASAIAGNKASPSLLIAFPICADNGIMPPIYMLVTITCGPQPGRSPITTAIKGRYKAKPLNKLSRSILKQKYPDFENQECKYNPSSNKVCVSNRIF